MSNTITPSPVDLATLDEVKSWLAIALDNHADDADIQDTLTAFSQWVCNYTGIRSFNQIAEYTEIRSGNGNNQMFVRNPPIINVASVTVNGVAVPLAGDWPAWGFYVADDFQSILIRMTLPPVSFNYVPTGFYNRQNLAGFARGQGNVKLVYNGGYERVPFDLERAATRTVALAYKRKGTIDIESRGIAAGGTTATTKFFMDIMRPEDKATVDFYQRKAIIT